MFLYLDKKIILICLVVFAWSPAVFSQKSSLRTRQRRETIEAYRVCNRFQELLGENLDFDRAFEATYTRNTSRRREIAITEGEFDSDNVVGVDNAILVDAFKSRMQLLFLMMPLFSPDSTEDQLTFFPPNIKPILDRKPPEAASEFAAYALRLKRDVADFRVHLDQLAQRYPNVAERIRDFKQTLTKKMEVPKETLKPQTAYSRGHILDVREEYYRIGDYAVIREGNTMRIIGIRFFRLF